MLIRIVLAVALVASLGACKTLTTGGGSAAGPQPSPQLTGSDEARFFSKSGLTACAGGALVGLATCKLSNTCDSDKGMITAALVGCGVGMGANYYLDQRRAEYANTEQRLDVMIADVREDNRKLQTLTATATDVLQQDRQKLATLKTQLAQQQVAKTAAQQQLAQVDANTRYLRTSLANLQKREQEWRQVAQAEQQKSQQHQQLNDEINRMQKQIISLQESVQDVEQQRAAIVLG